MVFPEVRRGCAGALAGGPGKRLNLTMARTPKVGELSKLKLPGLQSAAVCGSLRVQPAFEATDCGRLRADLTKQIQLRQDASHLRCSWNACRKWLSDRAMGNSHRFAPSKGENLHP